MGYQITFHLDPCILKPVPKLCHLARPSVYQHSRLKAATVFLGRKDKSCLSDDPSVIVQALLAHTKALTPSSRSDLQG